jgi:hypothetical protein
VTFRKDQCSALSMPFATDDMPLMGGREEAAKGDRILVAAQAREPLYRPF